MPIIIEPESNAGAGLFAPKTPTSAFVVGPHCILTYNSLSLNTRRELECYWVEDFVGFEDPDLRVSEEENPQNDGSTPNPGYYGSRVMTMTGYIRAGTYPKVLEMTRDLENAFMGLAERPLIISTLPGSYFEQPRTQIYCRKADKLIISKKIEQGDLDGIFRRAFTISLRGSDPVFRSTNIYEEIIIPTVVSRLGRDYPRDYPLAYDTYMDENQNAVVVGGGANSAIISNAGNWHAFPVLRFNGYMNGIRLSNGVTGHRIIFTEPVYNGDYIEIDTATGKVIDALGVTRGDYIDTSSDDLRLVGDRPPYDGQNPLTLSVSSFDDNASVSIRWQDAWMGG